MIPFETALSAAFGFIGRNWKLVLGGLVFAVLGIALVLAKADARHFRKLADSRLQAWQLEQAKHAVTRQSVETCTAAINAQNTAVQRLATEGEARAHAARNALEASQRAAERSQVLVRQLEASAAAPRSGEPCAPSQAFEKAKVEL